MRRCDARLFKNWGFRNQWDPTTPRETTTIGHVVSAISVTRSSHQAGHLMSPKRTKRTNTIEAIPPLFSIQAKTLVHTLNTSMLDQDKPRPTPKPPQKKKQQKNSPPPPPEPTQIPQFAFLQSCRNSKATQVPTSATRPKTDETHPDLGPLESLEEVATPFSRGTLPPPKKRGNKALKNLAIRKPVATRKPVKPVASFAARAKTDRLWGLPAWS